MRLALFALLAVALIGAAVVATLRQPQPPADVTEADAYAVLDRAIALATSGEHDRLCSDLGAGEGLCRHWLHELGGVRRIPHNRPEVVASQPLSASAEPKGWVLTLEGVDGQGDSYRSDFYVARAGRELAAPYPVYWMPLTVGPPRASDSRLAPLSATKEYVRWLTLLPQR